MVKNIKPNYRNIGYSLWYVVSGFILGAGLIQKEWEIILGGIALFLIIMINDKKSYMTCN